MNKSQELEVMVTRADIYADEAIAKYEAAWGGVEAKEIKESEWAKEEEDGDR